MQSCVDLRSEVFATLPAELRHAGEPNEWVRVTRPGERLHSFLEGPAWDDAGNLWCVDVPYGRIFRIDEHGAFSLEYAGDGQPHGLARLRDRTFAVADYRHGLLRFDPAQRTLASWHEGINSERFRGLGDIHCAANGDLWFTDPGRSSLSDPTGRLFRLRDGAAAPELVLANVPYPNGVATSPDGRFVYVAATRANAVWRLLADAPDPVYPMVGVWAQLSGGLGPDGLSVHPSGCVAIAHAQAGRAFVLDSLGDPVARIVTPGGLWTTAVAWHPDGRRLAIVDAQAGAVHLADLGHLLP
ncbi:MAG: SMP-30/gluconolactonase/LRE family protein [Burkholderiales bacterium]